MKLGKDEIQKIVLGALLFIILIYSYFDVLLGPLKKKRALSEQSIVEITKKVVEAKGQIRKTQDLESSVPEAEKNMNQVKAMIPTGAPVAWFPPQVNNDFERAGIDKATTRATGDQSDREVPGFRRMSWSVDLGKVEFITFAQALADFENNEPLAEISNVQIDVSADDVEMQRVFLNLRTTVTQ